MNCTILTKQKERPKLYTKIEYATPNRWRSVAPSVFAAFWRHLKQYSGCSNYWLEKERTEPWPSRRSKWQTPSSKWTVSNNPPVHVYAYEYALWSIVGWSKQFS